MSTTEIVLLVTTLAPIILGVLGRVLRASASQRVQAVGEVLEGAGVDLAKVARAAGDAKRGLPKAKVVP